MIQTKQPSVRDSLVQALGTMVPNGQMGGGPASGQLPAWMQQAISTPRPQPQMNPQDAAVMAGLASGAYRGGEYGANRDMSTQYNPMLAGEMNQVLGQITAPRPNRNGGRPAMPINAGGATTKPLPMQSGQATFKPLPMQSMEDGQRLKIDPARINNYVRPNLLSGQRQSTMTGQSFNKPLAPKTTATKKPAKKPIKKK